MMPICCRSASWHAVSDNHPSAGDLLAKVAVLRAQPVRLHGVLDHNQRPVERERLFQEVESTQLGGPYCSFNGAMPEMMTISGGLSNSRILCSVSSPSTPGNQMSSSTTAKGCFRRHRDKPRPTPPPWRSSLPQPEPQEILRMLASSSTISMLAWSGERQHQPLPSGLYFGGYGNSIINRAPTGAFPPRELSLMILYNSAHDRKAEAVPRCLVEK